MLDTTDARGLAEFYRQLLGMHYRPGDEPPPAGTPDPNGGDWLVLRGLPWGQLAFQQVVELEAPTWPEPDVPQQLHLDMTVDGAADFALAHDHALELGAKMILDRSDDKEEPLRVYRDPAGHPFCIFVAEPAAA